MQISTVEALLDCISTWVNETDICRKQREAYYAIFVLKNMLIGVV